MQECQEEITPDGYLDLSVNTNLLGNILDHGTKPTRGVIKEVSGVVPPSGVCSPSNITNVGLVIKGWLTHVQKGATSGTFSISETPLTDSVLNGPEELKVNLEETCGFVQSLHRHASRGHPHDNERLRRRGHASDMREAHGKIVGSCTQRHGNGTEARLSY